MPESGDKVWVIQLKGTNYFLMEWGWETTIEFVGDYSDLTVNLKDAMLFPTWARARMELNSMTGMEHKPWAINHKTYEV